METGQLVFVKDEAEGWVPATVGTTNGQGDEMSVELVHDDGTSEVSREVEACLFYLFIYIFFGKLVRVPGTDESSYRLYFVPGIVPMV